MEASRFELTHYWPDGCKVARGERMMMLLVGSSRVWLTRRFLVSWMELSESETCNIRRA